jgi:hypothetical protein
MDYIGEIISEQCELFEVSTAVELYIDVFWIMTACSLEDVISILTTEAVGSSEKSVITYETTQRHNPENHNLKKC